MYFMFVTQMHVGRLSLLRCDCQVAISAKGQSMRLAVAPAANVALWGSEGSAVEVPVPGGGARFLIRLNSLTGQVCLPHSQNEK